MTKEEAKTIIRNICCTFKGTMGDHQKIQEALRIAFFEKKEPSKEPEEDKA